MKVKQDEVFAFWYLSRLNPCNMRNLPCVQLHAIRCGLDDLKNLIVRNNARKYYYLLENFDRFYDELTEKQLEEFIERRGLTHIKKEDYR